MNGRTLAEVLIKAWAVVLLVEVVASTPTILMFLVQEPLPDEGLTRAVQGMQLVQHLTPLAAGLCLLIWGKPLAQWAIPETQSINVTLDSIQLTAIAFAVVGIWVLVEGLGNSATAAYVAFSTSTSDPRGNWAYLWQERREATIRGGIEVVVGLYLFLGRHGAGRLWSSLRGFNDGSQSDAAG